MKLYKKYIIAQRDHKTVYHIDGEIIKVFDQNYPKAHVLEEAMTAAYVESYGAPAPSVTAVTQIDGKWAISMEHIEGETMHDRMLREPRKKKKLLEKFVDIQIAMTQYKANGLRNTIDKHIEEVTNFPGLDPSVRYELLQRLQGMKRHTNLCHGDFVPSNVILTENGGYRVVDWTHATQGNAGADAAWTYLHFCLHHPDFADEYLKIYCKKSDTAIQYIQKWMPIVAVGRLAKNHPEEKELLEKWINIVDYM